jgi:hypothetical protein
MDSDVSGGSLGANYLYPCNSGRFLIRPKGPTDTEAKISTPCGILTSPFEDPPATAAPSVVQLSIDPPKVTFLLTDSPEKTVKISNAGSTAATITSIKLANQSQPNVLTLTNNCPSLSNPGGSCAVTMGNPKNLEDVSATIEVNATSANATSGSTSSYYHIDVEVQVFPPILTTSSASLALKANGVGPESSGTSLVTVSNSGQGHP